MLDLDPARASLCVDVCLGVRSDERVVILFDAPYAADAAVLATYVNGLGAVAEPIEVPERRLGVKEVSSEVAQRLLDADAVIVVFDPEDGCQFWHSTAREAASHLGARVGLLYTPASWDLAEADLDATRALTDRLGALLDLAGTAHLTTPAGTDLTLGLGGRPGFSCHSIITSPGDTATIPDWGDAEAAPVEGTTQGTVVYDGSMAFLGVIEEPVRVRVVDGIATDIIGGRQADELREILETAGPSSRSIAELGIGTVPRGGLTGHKDDKLFGTVHVALGHNRSLGGVVDSSVHLDGIIRRPSLWLDDRPVLVDGRLAGWLADELGRPDLAEQVEVGA